MKVLNELLYSKSHEWVKLEEQKAYVGISDYARTQLGQIVFIDLPAVGSTAELDEPLAEVESVKAVAEVISPVSGTVLEVNEELMDNPEALNEDAYESWLVLVELSDLAELKILMNAHEYEEYCDGLSKEGEH